VYTLLRGASFQFGKVGGEDLQAAFSLIDSGFFHVCI
jgi:hypothetical protein